MAAFFENELTVSSRAPKGAPLKNALLFYIKKGRMLNK
jgi:hypothetical protein